MTDSDEMQNDPLPEAVLEVLAHDLIVNKEMRDTACRLFDRTEAGLLHAMRKLDKREVQYARHTIRRRTINPVECWTCHAPKEAPGWLPEDHKPERLEISVRLEKAS